MYTVQRIPLPTPQIFPVGDVNVYLLGPRPLTLVDCGPGTEEAWEALVAGLHTAGASIMDIDRLILTHPHADHAGLAGRLQRTCHCSVYAYPADHARILGLPGAWDLFSSFLLEICRRGGAPEEALQPLKKLLRQMPEFYTHPETVEVIDEGCTLPQGSSCLHVLHTPGHARGSVCLWEPIRRLLLTGDTLLPHISSNAILEPGENRFRQRSFLRHQRSLDRLADLNPAEILPGHGEPMGNPSALIAHRRELIEKRLQDVLLLVRDGIATPWDIAACLFPHMETSYPYLAVSEVVGLLDQLALRGDVVFDGQGGPWVVLPA